MDKEQFIKDFKAQCISGYFEEHGVRYARVVNGVDGWLDMKLDLLLQSQKKELEVDVEKLKVEGLEEFETEFYRGFNAGIAAAIEILEK